jgi:hypothetical protein
MNKQVAAMCTLLLLWMRPASHAATVARHGASLDYDPAAFKEVYCFEWGRSPRPREHVPQPDDHFRSGELTFVLKTLSPTGSINVSLTPTTHRNAEYFKNTYPHISAEIAAVSDLLRDRPALPRIAENRQPQHPVLQHPVYLISKVRFFDYPWGSAIGLLEFDAQDSGNVAGIDPRFGWSRLAYTMYGLTADRRFYVNARMDVVHPELERGDNRRLVSELVSEAEYDAYLRRATRLMERSADEAFSPSLAVLHQVVSSLRINSKEALPEKWHRMRGRRKIEIEPEQRNAPELAR